jgi:predicted CoA-binding protein
MQVTLDKVLTSKKKHFFWAQIEHKSGSFNTTADVTIKIVMDRC